MEYELPLEVKELPLEMKKNLRYISKYDAQGNDFIIWQLSGEVTSEMSDFFTSDRVKGICSRESGMSGGADGFILLENIDASQKIFTLYNADGSPAEVSGNGLRCAGQALLMGENNFSESKDHESKEDQELRKYQIFTKFKGEKLLPEHEIRVSKNEDTYTAEVDFAPPKITPGQTNSDPLLSVLMHIPPRVSIYDQNYEVMLIAHTKNPHIVIKVYEQLGDLEKNEKFGSVVDSFRPRLKELEQEEVSQQKLEREGLELSSANIEFVEVIDRGTIRMKVHERGVGITKACGSGAVASVAVLRSRDFLDDEVTVKMDGGEAQVRFDNAKFDNGIYTLSGDVHFVELLYEKNK